MASTYFTYSPTFGQGDTTTSVRANSVNNERRDRTATLSITNGASTAQVHLRQKFCPYLTQIGSTTFPATGGSIYFTVNTEYDIVFRSVPDWITIQKNGVTYLEGVRISSGSANGTYELIAAPNSGEARSVGTTMNMAHYVGNELQHYYSYLNFTQETSDRILPLTFEILTGGTINFLHNRTLVSDVGDLTIQYQINDGTWTNLTSSTAGTSFQVAAGDVVKFKGDNAKYGSLPLSYTTFSGSTAVFNVAGNVMSLVNSTGFSGMSVVSEQYAFNRLFAGTNIISADRLTLPATTIAMHAYTSMFQGCTQMVKAPELPAPTLANSCYNEMFRGCSSLSHIRCYATDISAYNCTYNWVNGVATAGTFVKHTEMTGWTVGNDGIPTDWVIQNYTPTSVTKSISLMPTTVDVNSASTSTTVNIIAENCNFDHMATVTGGSFVITVASVQNNVITLTFPANPGAQRVGTLTFTLYDSEGGEYGSTVSISQAAAYIPPVERQGTITATTTVDGLGAGILSVDLDVVSNTGYTDSTTFSLTPSISQANSMMDIKYMSDGSTQIAIKILLWYTNGQGTGMVRDFRTSVSYGGQSASQNVTTGNETTFTFNYSSNNTATIVMYPLD